MNIYSIFLNSFLITTCDSAERWQTGIQDPATPMLEGMLSFYNELMFYIVFIGIAVICMLYVILTNFREENSKKSINFSHASLLEIIWTIIPAILLFFISVPSFTLLYSLDELVDPALTIKIVGNQWYWNYEYSDFCGIKATDANENVTQEELTFDSYILNEEYLTLGSLRNLEVDKRVVMPVNTHIRLLMTSADVLHSWAVPSLGIKLDAAPGRLSQTSLFIKREGVFYGQCSEICGINHGFMPIAVVCVSKEEFITWLSSRKES